MPVYTYQCPECGRRAEAHRTIDYRDDGPDCLRCRQLQRPTTMVRVLDAPMGIVNGPAVPRDS